MIKAKKGLLIGLFAAMMVFAFGATSVFATDYEVVWSDDLTTVTVDGAPADVVKSFQSDGLTKVQPALNGDVISGHDRFYYDFTGATLDGWDNNGTTVSLGTIYTNSGYKTLEGKYAVFTLVKPTGASGNKEATVTLKGTANWTAILDVDEELDNETDVPATIAVKFSAKEAQTGEVQKEMKKNETLGPVNVTVQGKATGAKAYFYAATDKNKNEVKTVNNAKYNGEEHAYVADELSGYSLVISKYNASTAAWDTINASDVKWKDATDDVAKYRAVWTPTSYKDGVTTKIADLTIGAVQASGVTPTYQWTDGNTTTSGNTWFQIGAQKYQVTPEQAEDPTQFIDFDNALGNSDAEDADIEEIKAVFGELYTVKVKKNEVDANQQRWTIDKVATGDDWTKAWKASKKAHETLFTNYNLNNGLALARMTSSYVDVVIAEGPAPVLQDDIVDITFAPTAKTYHVKKAKKLKANKSFTVEATSKSGNAITYVLKTPNKKITIDPATGKVTVKKGIKKGTYKIKVTARTDAGNGYKAAQDVANITIKVKK